MRIILVAVFLFACSGCADRFPAGMFTENNPVFSSIDTIALLQVEYRQNYKKLGAGTFSSTYTSILHRKGYTVAGELEVRDKLAQKGFNLDTILKEKNYAPLVKLRIADAGIIAQFQENAAAPPSNFIELIDLKTGETIWYRSMIWRRYKNFDQMPLVREMETFLSPIPHARRR